MSSFNAGKQLKEAVQKSNNPQWKVQLSAAINADDARAIDVKYHLKCWVQNVQRNKNACDESQDLEKREHNVGVVASDIEFIGLVRSSLQAGEVINMLDLKSVYSTILGSNGVHNVQISGKDIKKKISSYIQHVQFIKPKRRTDPDLVCLSKVCNAAVEEVMTKTTYDHMLKLFESASIL